MKMLCCEQNGDAKVPGHHTAPIGEMRSVAVALTPKGKEEWV